MLKDRRFPALRTDFIFGNKPFSAHPANSERDCSHRKIRLFAFFTHRNYAARRFAHRTVLTVTQNRCHKPQNVNQLLPQHKNIFFHIIYIAAFCKKRQFFAEKIYKKSKKNLSSAKRFFPVRNKLKRRTRRHIICIGGKNFIKDNLLVAEQSRRAG